MAQGFTYRRIQPDIEEAALILELLGAHVGERIVELSKERKIQEIHKLTGMEQRWAELVGWLKEEAEAEAEDLQPPVEAGPTSDAPTRRSRKGGDAAATDNA